MNRMCRFAVGDIVTVKPDITQYRVTGQGCICEVRGLYQNGNIEVYVIKSSEGAEDGERHTFTVTEKNFMYADMIME